MQAMEKPSLYDRLGGVYSIATVVDDLIDQIMVDSRLNANPLVDEAHHLSMEVLEEIRLLTNLETSQKKLLQIVLAGQPELDQKLDSHELRQLKQRVALRCHLPDEMQAHNCPLKQRSQVVSSQILIQPLDQHVHLLRVIQIAGRRIAQDGLALLS